MPTYTVQKAQEVKRIPAKDDRPELVVYGLTLTNNGHSIECERAAKVGTPMPQVGSTVEGDIEDGRFGKKFKPTRSGGNGYRRRDPSETRAIQRQHSQDMALRYISIKASLGALPAIEGKQGFDLSDVFTIADQFDRDLEPASQKSDTPYDPNA